MTAYEPPQYRIHSAHFFFIVQETVAEWSSVGHPYHGNGLQPVNTFQTIHDTNNCLDGFSNLISLDQINAASATPIERTTDVTQTYREESNAYNPDDLMQNVTGESVSSTAQFSCKEAGCSKSYTTISGLNNHIKKYATFSKLFNRSDKFIFRPYFARKHSGISLYPCDECPETFSATYERTMHKIQQHEGRRYQTSRHSKTNEVAKLKCNFQDCGKEFSKLVSLNKHSAVHNTM